MSGRETREVVQKINEVIERLESFREYLKLKQMETRITIARLKATARAKSGHSDVDG